MHMLIYEQNSCLLMFVCVYLTPAPRLCADVEVLLLVDVQSLSCSSLLACDDSLLVGCSTATVLGGTVLVGLDGLEVFGLLPVLQVLAVLTLGDPADGFLGFAGEKLLYCPTPCSFDRQQGLCWFSSPGCVCVCVERACSSPCELPVCSQVGTWVLSWFPRQA
jgi:hypothetical protein